MQPPASYAASRPEDPSFSPLPPPDSLKTQEISPPGPEEVLAHYESQGLSTREASLRAIGELQDLLNNYTAKKERFAVDFPRKLDAVNARLGVLEMKAEAKPGFPESLAAGIAASALVSEAHHLLGCLRGIWVSVHSATKGSP